MENVHIFYLKGFMLTFRVVTYFVCVWGGGGGVGAEVEWIGPSNTFITLSRLPDFFSFFSFLFLSTLTNKANKINITTKDTHTHTHIFFNVARYFCTKYRTTGFHFQIIHVYIGSVGKRTQSCRTGFTKYWPVNKIWTIFFSSNNTVKD